MFGFRVEPPPPVDLFYEGQGPIAVRRLRHLVHHTPGHCPGGVCLQVGQRGERGLDLIVGDTLFAGSIGRTDLPGGDYETLLRSITQVLFPFRRRCARLFGPRPEHDHRRRAAYQSLPARVGRPARRPLTATGAGG